MVLRRCRALLRDEAAASDALQDVFLLLVRHGERLQPERPASLLLRMATHVCLNRLRAARRQPWDLSDADLLAIAATFNPEPGWLARLQLGGAFAASLRSTALIAVLHHVDGLTHEEVAREVGLSVSGVRKRLRGLRAQLQRQEELS
jgi:RNA polymerase sigma-70 factor (ECF subfamily)